MTRVDLMDLTVTRSTKHKVRTRSAFVSLSIQQLRIAYSAFAGIILFNVSPPDCTPKFLEVGVSELPFLLRGGSAERAEGELFV